MIKTFFCLSIWLGCWWFKLYVCLRTWSFFLASIQLHNPFLSQNLLAAKGFCLTPQTLQEPEVGRLVKHSTMNKTLWSAICINVSQTSFLPKQPSNYNLNSQIAWLQEYGMPEQKCLYSSWPGSSVFYQINKVTNILAHISVPCDNKQHKPVFLALISCEYLAEWGFHFRKTEHQTWLKTGEGHPCETTGSTTTGLSCQHSICPVLTASSSGD